MGARIWVHKYGVPTPWGRSNACALRRILSTPELSRVASAGNDQDKMARNRHFLVPRLQVQEALFDSFFGLSGSSMTFAWPGGRCDPT